MMELRKGRQLNAIDQWSQVFKTLLLGLVVLASVFAVSQIKLTNYFPIKTVRVYGINHVDQREIQQLLFPLVNRGFFAINIEYIRERLLQLPWVSDTVVRRAWPDQVEITVVERRAVARWNQESILSEGGELFTPTQGTYPADLPVFTGPSGKQIIMLEYFTELNRLLAPLHAKISSLELTPYLTWKLMLTNGITLQIGRKDVLTRVNHFVKVYPKIVGNRAAAVDYIDLRYPNGVAVRWKAPVNT